MVHRLTLNAYLQEKEPFEEEEQPQEVRRNVMIVDAIAFLPILGTLSCHMVTLCWKAGGGDREGPGGGKGSRGHGLVAYQPSCKARLLFQTDLGASCRRGSVVVSCDTNPDPTHFPKKNTTHYYKFGGAEMFMKEPRPKQGERRRCCS